MSCLGMCASTVPVCVAYPVDCAICVCMLCGPCLDSLLDDMLELVTKSQATGLRQACLGLIQRLLFIHPQVCLVYLYVCVCVCVCVCWFSPHALGVNSAAWPSVKPCWRRSII